jgi:hypothetical protein
MRNTINNTFPVQGLREPRGHKKTLLSRRRAHLVFKHYIVTYNHQFCPLGGTHLVLEDSGDGAMLLRAHPNLRNQPPTHITPIVEGRDILLGDRDGAVLHREGLFFFLSPFLFDKPFPYYLRQIQTCKPPCMFIIYCIVSLTLT